ncbi:DUF2141 domain-containing protein [Magnetospira sp. QH-2]|uniref:DUF2141 domain-containing protein n=1 Tax=Magnetospira sp. (strain QH-2) TaxID=1288970 RepID=UPI0018E07EDC|nr:DUF2141 domain-containing protein [Magnetospira sp. QH-2]
MCATVALVAGMVGVSVESRAADLEVVINGLRDHGGTVRAFIWKGEEDFRDYAKATHSTRFNSRPGRAVLAFSGLEPGQYAIMVYHDEDNDQELDRFLGMIPTEGWALSNNPKITGRPAFEDAAVTIEDPGAQIVVRMVY